MKRLIACAALVAVGTIVFGQVGVEKPGSIQSQSNDVPVIIGGRTDRVVIGGRVESRRSNRPPEPVLLRKLYIEQVQERAKYMSAEELEVAIEQLRQETNQIKVKRAEESDALLKAFLEKQANR